MLKIIEIFSSNASSISAVYYQYQKKYNFNSPKPENEFKIRPATFQEGVIQMSETIYKKIKTIKPR